MYQLTVFVLQYISELDDWVELGEMAESRTFHTVVTVPNSVCSVVAGEESR